MTLPLFVSLEVLLVKMMRLPLSFVAVSKRKQADFPSARKQQWEPNLQQHRWAAVTAWAETAVGGGVILRHWGETTRVALDRMIPYD